jgi:hypothetical protein
MGTALVPLSVISVDRATRLPTGETDVPVATTGTSSVDSWSIVVGVIRIVARGTNRSAMLKTAMTPTANMPILRTLL